MSAIIASDMDSYQLFLGQQRAHGIVFSTPEESVHAYREFERELRQMRELLRPAFDESARGETFVLDPKVLKSEVAQSLASKGIPDCTRSCAGRGSAISTFKKLPTTLASSSNASRLRSP